MWILDRPVDMGFQEELIVIHSPFRLGFNSSNFFHLEGDEAAESGDGGEDVQEEGQEESH